MKCKKRKKLIGNLKNIGAIKMKCRKCGNEMSKNDAFCGVCGAKRPEYRKANANNTNKSRKRVNSSPADESEPKIYIIIITVVALLFIGIAAALFGYILYGGQKTAEDSQTTEIAVTSQVPEKATERVNTVKQDPDDKKNTQTPRPTSNTGNNGKSGSSSGGNQASGAVENPSFRSYSDNEYKFSCEYPSHFVTATGTSKFVRRSYKAPDNSATVNICATQNSTGLNVKKVQDNFKASFPGTVDYENSGSDWCVCRTVKDGMYHYGYFSLKNGMIRGFEMHFDGAHYSIYEKYVDYIYDSLILN